MSNTLCPVCDKSEDDGSDHTLCALSTFAAILTTIGGIDVNTAITAVIAAAYGAGFTAKFESVVGIPVDGSTNGKYQGFAEIAIMRGPISRTIVLSTQPFDTPEEANTACEDIYENFYASCREQGDVHVVDDPAYGRNQN